MKSFSEMATRDYGTNCGNIKEYGDIWNHVTDISYEIIHKLAPDWKVYGKNQETPRIQSLDKSKEIIDAAMDKVFNRYVKTKQSIESTLKDCLVEMLRSFYQDTPEGKIEYDVLVVEDIVNSFFSNDEDTKHKSAEATSGMYRNLRKEGKDSQTAKTESIKFGTTPITEQKT